MSARRRPVRVLALVVSARLGSVSQRKTQEPPMPKRMTEIKAIKCRLFNVYDTAENIDVADLLCCRPAIRSQYDQIMTVWRKILIVLDTVRQNPSERAGILPGALQRSFG
jgi:hypothetical protein